jgi:hypothetical protein
VALASDAPCMDVYLSITFQQRRISALKSVTQAHTRDG